MEKSIILNQNCFGWDKDSNLFRLRRYEIYFNDVLRERGYVFLYEIYNVIGNQTQEEHVVKRMDT